MNKIIILTTSMRSRALLSFYALTGSNTTSAINKRDKKTAWNVWQLYCCYRCFSPFFFPKEVDDTVMEYIEDFVVDLYEKNY